MIRYHKGRKINRRESEAVQGKEERKKKGGGGWGRDKVSQVGKRKFDKRKECKKVEVVQNN